MKLEEPRKPRLIAFNLKQTDDGQLAAEGHYRAGKEEGSWRFWARAALYAVAFTDFLVGAASADATPILTSPASTRGPTQKRLFLFT